MVRRAHPADARTIARLLGGDVISSNRVLAPGPGHSPNDRSLSILLDARSRDGMVIHSFAVSDDWRTCRDYVLQRLGLDPRNDSRPQLAVISNPVHDDKKRKQEIALRIWHDAVDPAGTLVERYLREHRKLPLDAAAAGRVIRFHRALFFDRDTRLPGMVALLRDISDDEPCGIIRTFLHPQTAEKVARKMLGRALCAAVKLDRPTDRLVVCEGVETAMAARLFGYRPAWALGSAGAVRDFPLLDRLRELVIAKENDPTSRNAVTILRKRYCGARKPVEVISPTVGSDLADAWKAVADG